MAEQKESSVLFSLKELMSLEEDRIAQEEAEKEAHARAEMEAKAAAERAAREAEEARMRAEDEARRMEEQRRREEEARLAAIQHAEVEKARAEAEHRARLEAMQAQQAHEHQLATLKGDKHKKRLQIIVGVVSAVLIIGGVTGGVLWKKSADEAEKRAAALEAQRKATEEELARLKRDFEDAAKKEEALKKNLASAKDEAERAKIEAQLAKAKKEKESAGRALSHSTSGGGSKPASGGGSKPCNCPPAIPSAPACDPATPPGVCSRLPHPRRRATGCGGGVRQRRCAEDRPRAVRARRAGGSSHWA